MLEECREDESGESWWKRGRTREWMDKRMDQKEKQKQNVKFGGRIVSGLGTAAYNEMFCIICETCEEILTAIRPVKNYHELSCAWSNKKNYHRLS